MSKRAATYVRVSTEDQAKHGYSLDSQVEACRKYAEEKGWMVVAEISDDGISGTRLDRPGLDRIRDMAQGQEIDAVIVYALDRLSRKLIYQLIIEDELDKADVIIHYVLGRYDDTDEGRMMRQMRGVFAEYEVAQTLERLERGKRSKAGHGLAVGAGRIAYGYRYSDGHLIIMQEEARVVRLIFDWYTSPEEVSIREIARRLTALAFKTHQGNTHWRTGTVSLILANETYVGAAYYNRRKRKSATQTVFRPQEEWIAIPVPPIVDRATFETVQRHLAHNRKMMRKQPRHKYLLRGMLTCAKCGRAYCGEFKNARCYYRHGRDGPHYAPFLRADLAEQNVWEAVKQLLLNPSTLWEGYRAKEAEVTKQKRRLIERLDAILKLKAKTETKLEALTNAYLDPDIGMPKAEYTRHRQYIKKAIADWEREAREIQARLETEAITQERMEAIETFAAEVSEGIELLDFEAKRKVLRMLEVSGKVYHEDEDPWIELEGLFPPGEVGLLSRTSQCS